MSTRPTYPWFDQVPDHLKTKNQLGELGLEPGGPIVATVEWDRGKKYAFLYELSQAVAKKPLSAQDKATIEGKKYAFLYELSQAVAKKPLSAQDKATIDTCPVCRRLQDHILWGPTCDECTAYAPNGQPHTTEGYFSVHGVEPHIYRVWLPEQTAYGPYAAPVEAHQRYYDWIPYPKVEFRLVLSDRAHGPLLPGHTHAWFFARPIVDLLAEWTPAEFVALAEIWPILREWAIDASLPNDRYVAQALMGLDRAAAAELRFTWYERRTTYYRDMKAYT